MNRFTMAAVATVLGAATATAGGLDRSNQNISAIFSPANTLSFSVSHVKPTLEGTDVGGTGTGTYDAGNSYSTYQFSYTNEVNDKFSYAIIGDQPFGADIFYNDNPLTSNVGGTRADLSSDALSFIGKYQFSDRVSVFGGLRAQRVGGRVSLNGQAYAGAIATSGVARAAGVDSRTLGAALQGDPNAVTALGGAGVVGALGAQVSAVAGGFLAGGGYDLRLEDDWGVGLTVGAAYEIPEIALRLAVTYHSEVSHNNDTTESFPVPGGGIIPSQIAFASPQSVNIDFQTGINPKTLLLAGVRWTDWDDFDVVPTALGSDLADIDDTYRWTLGVARRFTDEFVGLASMTYEKDNGSSTVSPLGPTDGQIGLSLGGRYTAGNLDISGGVNYTMVGDADAGVAGQARAAFRDSSAFGVGLKLDYRF